MAWHSGFVRVGWGGGWRVFVLGGRFGRASRAVAKKIKDREIARACCYAGAFLSTTTDQLVGRILCRLQRLYRY